MKRIIDGATYNTDTSTVIATGTHEDEYSRTLSETVLYQSRSGVYFSVDKVTTTRRRRDGEDDDRITHEWEVVGDARKANEYCERYSLTILRDIEDMPPEAVLGEKLATVYLRVTPTLKADLDEASSEDKISGNLWATRCLEKCLGQRSGAGLTKLFQIRDIAWNFANDDAFGASRAKCMEALGEIFELSSALAERLCGGEGQMLNAEVSFRSDHEAQQVTDRFGAAALAASAPGPA